MQEAVQGNGQDSAHSHTHSHARDIPAEQTPRMAPEHPQGHAHRHTQTQAVLNRLSRAIGHLESIRKMVEDGRDCAEVLIQLAAVQSALGGASRVILKDHIASCIVDAVETGDRQALEDLNHAIDRLLK